MNTRHAGIALVLVVTLAGCASSGASPRAATPASLSTTTGTTVTAPPGTTMRWSADAEPSVPEQKCGSPQLCVLLGTETGTFDGDLRGAFFRGNTAAFGKKGHFVVGVTAVFRGAVKGCGAGTLVLVGTELADVHGGTGEWRIADGFGTGALAHVTGHGTGTGTVGAAGYRSQWRGEIDCGR